MYRALAGDDELSLGQGVTVCNTGQRVGRLCVYFKPAVESQRSA